MKIPQTIQDAIKKLDNTFISLPKSIDECKSNLQALSAEYKSNGLYSSAQEGSSVRAVIDEILLQDCRIVTVHPYQFNRINYSLDLKRYLSPENAVQLLSEKLTDPEDSGKDDAKALFCIFIADNSISSWIQKLKTFNTVFELGETLACEQRATQMYSIETTKMILKNPADNPAWTYYEITSGNTAAKIKSISDEMIADVEVYASDLNPVQEIIDLINTKKEEIQNIQTAWQNLISKTQGSIIYAYYFTGSNTYSLAQQIKTVTIPNQKYCAGVALISSPENLIYFKEAFEL